jgi:hypothetical protein
VRHLLSVVVASAVAAAPAPAQELPAIPDSARIRVWAPTLDMKKESALFLAWQPASVRIVPTDQAETIDLPFTSVTRMDVRDGKDHVRGILLGGSVGGLVGAVLGLAIGERATDGCRESLCGLETIDYMAKGMVIGVGIGGAFGAVAPPDRWVRQSLPAEAGFPQPGPDLSWLYATLAGLALIAISSS